jgi:signal transduction histidine kinase
VDAQTVRLANLINDLLDVSRISAGKLDLRPAEMDLGELAAEVLSRFQEHAFRVGSPLSLVAPSKVLGVWDRSRIDQVITNLVSNALKYGAGKPVEVAVEADENAARLSVRDQGVGIPQSEQERIFHRFERASTTRNISGIGLGLWIVKQILTAHGGHVEVSSRPGEGAMFVCALPR